MAWAFVQKNVTSDFTGTTHTSLTVTCSAVGTGNLVFGFIEGADATQTCTVKDNNGVSATMVPTSSGVLDSSNGNRAWMWYAPNVSGAPTSYIATFSAATGFCGITLQEWSGGATTTPLDQSQITNQTSSATPTGTTVTPGQSGELIFAAVVPDSGGAGTITAGTNVAYTIRNNVAGDLADESFVQTTAAAVAGSFHFTTAQATQIGIMTFKVAGSAAAPFHNYDFPNPRGYVYYPVSQWTDLGLATLPTPTVLPLPLRTQRYWELTPRSYPRLWPDYTWIDSGNNFPPFPTNIPFNQDDWPLPRSITWYRDWNQNLVTTTLFPTVQAPFSQSYWPNPAQPYRIDESWVLNNTIYQPTPPAVVSVFEWQVVPGPSRPDFTWIETGNALTAVTQNPFFQTDWPLPKTSQPLLQTWSQSLNVFYQSETFPFVQSDWPNPQRIVWYKDWFVNLLQSTLTPAFQAPFNQFDWPLPRTYIPIQQFWAEAGNVQLPFPTPFFQNVNSPLPVVNQPIDQTWIQNLASFLLPPFNQEDWPNPKVLQWYRDWYQALAPYLPPGQSPFVQSDWPNPRTYSPIDQFWVNNLNLLPTPSTVKPFNQTDWPNPRDYQRIDESFWQALALILPPPPPPVETAFGGKQWDPREWEKRVLQMWMKHIRNK